MKESYLISQEGRDTLEKHYLAKQGSTEELDKTIDDIERTMDKLVEDLKELDKAPELTREQLLKFELGLVNYIVDPESFEFELEGGNKHDSN